MHNSNSQSIQPVACLLFLIGLVLAMAYSWCHREARQSELESRMLDDFSFWALPNTEYSQDYVLPEWVISELDDDLADKFYRITELDFCIDNLNFSDLDAIKFYVQFRSVHTIRVQERYCKPEVVEILRSFKNLKTINVEPWGSRKTAGYIELSSKSLPGVEVIYKK